MPSGFENPYLWVWIPYPNANPQEVEEQIARPVEEQVRTISGIKNVNSENSPKDDTMQTFWIAESLKYFLLLFSDDDALDLTTHVINTEAHPMRIIG